MRIDIHFVQKKKLKTPTPKTPIFLQSIQKPKLFKFVLAFDLAKREGLLLSFHDSSPVVKVVNSIYSSGDPNVISPCSFDITV